MSENLTSRFDEVQPNSVPREELLIVLEYLQKFAYDKDHKTSQAEIVKYAEERYGKTIRRDRIGQILIHLEQISKKGDLSLPFELKTVELNKTKKYYVGERTISDDSIIKIVAALKKDKSLSKAQTDLIISQILDNLVSKGKQADITGKAVKRSGGAKKINPKLYDVAEEFLKAVDNLDTLIFKVNDPSEIEISCKETPEIKKLIASMKTEETFGFAHSLFDLPGTTIAVIYLNDIKQVITTPLYNLQICRTSTRWSKSNKITFELNNPQYKRIDEWLNQHYSGKDGQTYDFLLKITVNSRKKGFHFTEFVNKYKEYWHEVPQFEYKDRMVDIKNGDGTTKQAVAVDAFFRLTANLSSFYKWYDSMGNFDEVVIIEPAFLNDVILRDKIYRYARRLTKYGTHHNYTVTSEMKPEYLAYVNSLKEKEKAKSSEEKESK